MTPLGYMPLTDAIDRCIKAWSVDPQEAYERLRSYLDALEIKSLAKYADGNDKNLGRAWASYLNDKAYVDGKLIFDQGGLDGRYGLPAYVHTADLQSLLDPASEASEPQTADKNKGGGQEKHDWEGMWIETVALIHEEGIPATQNELRTKLLQWFTSTYDKEPGRTTIQPKIEKLWKRLHRDP